MIDLAYDLLKRLSPRKVRRVERVDPSYSSARPDPRDPMTAELAITTFLDTSGWHKNVETANVIHAWPEIVGPEIASHVTAESCSERVLIVTADSTAWATQMRLLQRKILSRIAEVVGNDVITKIDVRGGETRQRTRGWNVPEKGVRKKRS